ncbi:MAG: hypothetical protein HXS53_09105 [Theionarchaea archaeon]|nr:hypothetical protein [Theionarchaea archaeon]
MVWLKKFRTGLENCTEEEVKRKVLEGSEEINLRFRGKPKTTWIKGAIDKLDELVDEETRKKILLSCCDVFPKTRIKPLRDKYHETGSIDQSLNSCIKTLPGEGFPIMNIPRGKGIPFMSQKIPVTPLSGN